MTIKEECFKCKTFNPNARGSYKCNTSKCPSRCMDLEERMQLIEEREYDKRAWENLEKLSELGKSIMKRINSKKD